MSIRIPSNVVEPIPIGTGAIHIVRKGRSKSILLTSLTRPRVKNAFSDDMYNDLILLLQTASTDDSISGIVLTGQGPYFSSGADLKNTNFLGDDNDDDEEGESSSTWKKPPGRFMLEMIRFPKLIAAAVNGPAVGIGVTLLMHCDLCYCTKEATFWAPFTRLAIVPEFCSSETFLDSMGLAKANELLLLGRKIDAKKAVEWNICSEILRVESHIHDPFHDGSIASIVCQRIDQTLLTLPVGDASSKIFVEMVRKRRLSRYEKLCKEELDKLDERKRNGEPLEAAMALGFGKSKL